MRTCLGNSELLGTILRMLRGNCSEADIRESLVKNFDLTETQAADKIKETFY